VKYRIIEALHGQYVGKITEFWYLGERYLSSSGTTHFSFESVKFFGTTDPDFMERLMKAHIESVLEGKKFPRIYKEGRHP
jgi:hypothetical protein